MNDEIIAINKQEPYYKAHPLRFALLIGLLVRLVAVIFSKGFGMHDDHFLVIEAAQSWVDGSDYNNWLPGSGNTTPSGHSFFYCGLHYIFFYVLQFFGVYDPQIKMVFVRFVHALLSLFVIYYGFKITERVGNTKSAGQVAFLLAVLWFMPFLSVRNLVEVVCIPFLAAGTWYVMDAGSYKRPMRILFMAGILLGLAFCIRFQSLFYVLGIGLALLIQLKWRESLIVGAGVLLSFCAIQGIVDTFIWGRPFAEFMAYVQYNIDNANNYILGPWYNYLLLILGILIPPVSIFLFYGYLRTWRKHLIVFLPVMLFLVFHSYFPNKQERFIIPIIPFIIMLGVAGWNDYLEKHPPGNRFRKFIRGSWIFFWVLNFTLLPFISTMYSKKARVESMIYLSRYRNSINNLLLEDAYHDTPKMPPEFYLQKWVHCYELSEGRPLDSLKAQLKRYAPFQRPDFVLFFEDTNLPARVDTVKTLLPGLRYETTIQPGFIDKVLFWMNPKNANQVIYIYRVDNH